jgi:hypothetical protein
MHLLSKAIPGAGYSEGGDTLGFHFEDLSVVVEGRVVTIVGAEDEARAIEVMGYLAEKSSNHRLRGEGVS